MLRLPAALLLATLLIVWFTLAPPNRPELWPWLVELMTGRWEGIEPWVIVHFNLMGLWPLLMLGVLAPFLRARPVPALPFVLGGMFLGVFVLLPWIIFGGLLMPPRSPGMLEKIVTSKAWFLMIAALAGGFLCWGVAWGTLAAWNQERQMDGFIWVMTLDFIGFYLTSVAVIRARDPQGWYPALVPLVGAALWGTRQGK